MKTLIVTLALVSILATSTIAKTDLVQLIRNYPCPEYNRTDQTCGVHKEKTSRPNSGRQNGHENITQQ
jgi:hypothetical protein